MNPEGSEDSDHIHYDVKTVIEFAAAESARLALARLISKLDGWVGSQRVKLMIYFDEAHPLTKVVPKNDDEKTLYDFLCSCLNQFLFYAHVSTNSDILHFLIDEFELSPVRFPTGPCQIRSHSRRESRYTRTNHRNTLRLLWGPHGQTRRVDYQGY